MTDFISRRTFLSLSAAAAPSLAFAQTSLFTFLNSPKAEDVVFEVLRDHFQLDDSHRGLATVFYQRLLRSPVHTESGEYFSQLLAQKDLLETLEKYVVQEFVVASNYLEYQTDRSQALVLLEEYDT